MPPCRHDLALSAPAWSSPKTSPTMVTLPDCSQLPAVSPRACLQIDGDGRKTKSQRWPGGDPAVPRGQREGPLPGAVPRARDRVSVPRCPLTSSPLQWKQQQTDVKPQLPKPRDRSPAMPTGWLRSCLEARGHSSHLPAPGWGRSNSAVGVTQNLAPKRVCRGWSHGAMKHLSLRGLCSTSALLHPQFLPCQSKP